MNIDLKHYREMPLGQQLCVPFEQRTELRRSIPLFSFSLAKLKKPFEDDVRTHDDHLQHV